MRLTCPNDPEHDSFYTTAEVLEEWITDRHGNWQETTATIETTRAPTADSQWLCKDCQDMGRHSQEARVERD